MHAPKRILLVYALPHSGHSSAAAALQEELERQGFEVTQYNFQEQWTRLGKKAGDLQKWIVEHTPWFWKHVHGNEDYAGVTQFLVDGLTRWDITGLFAKIEAFKPDAIVATHMFPLRMLGEARISGHLNVPLFVVTTDLWVHRYWAHLGVDRYFASTKEAKTNLIKYGINPARIQVTGIPLRSAFVRRTVRSEVQAKKRLGLSTHKPHVTIVGGTYGIFPFQSLLKAILAQKKTTRSVQWTCIFGKDEKQLKKAERFLRKYPETNIRLLGFTHEIELYFSASDLVITKPGGLTTSEVVACDVPLVLCAPIPGQEEGNAAVLVGAKAAIREDDPAKLVSRVMMLLSEEALRLELRAAAHALIPRKSSVRIAHTIAGFFEKMA